MDLKSLPATSAIFVMSLDGAVGAKTTLQQQQKFLTSASPCGARSCDLAAA
jgi:hypothetical protein